jgi:hypothetical protein
VNPKLLFPLLGLVVFGAAAMSPWRGMKTNCGGNSAALASVHRIAIAATVRASDPPDHRFHFAAVSGSNRDEFADYAYNHWLPGAHFLVCRTPVIEGEPKRIIVVCDTPYGNVPRRWIGSAPPAHAAAYSDGSYGLISAQEFAAVDRSAFVPLDELYPRGSKSSAAPPWKTAIPPVLPTNRRLRGQTLHPLIRS